MTDDQLAQILAHVAVGNYLEVAAVAAGVDPELVAEMVKAGEEPNSEHAWFRAAVVQALAKAECDSVAAMFNSAEKDAAKWRAWILERTNPARWSLKVREAIEEDKRGTIERILGLEATIGREALLLVLGAIAGRDSRPEAEAAGTPGVH